MTRIKQLAGNIRWKTWLPIVAVAITTLLIFLSAAQETMFWAAHPGFTDTPSELQQPAKLFAELLNGPSFLFDFSRLDLSMWGMPVDGFGRLPLVAIFWTWLGWALDRRLRGTHTPLIRLRWLRAALYAGLLVLTGLFIYSALTFLNFHEFFSAKTLRAYWDALGLRGFELGVFAMLAWAVGYLFLFGYKLLATFKPRHSTEK
jgi:hypothetical protein